MIQDIRDEVVTLASCFKASCTVNKPNDRNSDKEETPNQIMHLAKDFFGKIKPDISLPLSLNQSEESYLRGQFLEGAAGMSNPNYYCRGLPYDSRVSLFITYTQKLYDSAVEKDLIRSVAAPESPR
jgi:hypothetical protein